MTTASAAAASPTDGSEFPWREILFVWAVQAGRVFQQDIPTEGSLISFSFGRASERTRLSQPAGEMNTGFTLVSLQRRDMSTLHLLKEHTVYIMYTQPVSTAATQLCLDCRKCKIAFVYNHKELEAGGSLKVQQPARMAERQRGSHTAASRPDMRERLSAGSH
ncbi:hypothetical protein PAMP_008354 [Pampus punctatissimus]